jgi:hypothetical protein
MREPHTFTRGVWNWSFLTTLNLSECWDLTTLLEGLGNMTCLESIDLCDIRMVDENA